VTERLVADRQLGVHEMDLDLLPRRARAHLKPKTRSNLSLAGGSTGVSTGVEQYPIGRSMA
jgi:hypothetical protein